MHDIMSPGENIMKKILTIALAGILSTGTIANVSVAPVFAQEEENQAMDKNTISNSFELSIDTSKEEYLNVVKDEHYFDGKTSENPLYDLLKEQIIKIAKGEGELTFTFDISFSLTEEEIKDVLDQIVKDMEPYFYWSNGKGVYFYEEDSQNSITFSFERNNELFVNEEGVYSDGNGNQLIPWEKIEEKNLTLDDLKKICGESLVLVMDADGEHILFVGGNFSDKTVKSDDQALKAIDCMKDLMGIPDNTTLVCSKVTEDPRGNTYYAFTTRQDGGLNKNKIVIVGVNKDGKVSSVSNSSQDDWSGEDCELNDANEFIDQFIKDNNVEYLEEYGINEEFYAPLNQECYVFIARTAGGNYCKVYCGKVNTGTDNQSVEFYNSLEALFDENQRPYDFYFDNNTDETDVLDFKDNYGNIVSLPVAYKEGCGYYLYDKERKIIGTINSRAMVCSELAQPYYFDSPEKASSIFVSAFNNMMNSFDSYKELGLFETDRPIIINFFEVNAVDNAQADYFSDSIYINIFNSNVGACFDVVSHELTHAIQKLNSSDSMYKNANGALMESYGDICGNILEMLAKEQGKLADKVPVDTIYWALGESKGSPDRIMSNPEATLQPSKVYDKYFAYPLDQEMVLGDKGGVHTNSGILNNIAYRMNADANLSKGEVLTLFYLTEYLCNIHTDYSQVGAYIEFYMQQLDYSKEQIESVKTIFKEACVQDYDKNIVWYEADPNDVSKIFTVSLSNEKDGIPDKYALQVYAKGTCNKRSPLTKYGDKYGQIIPKDDLINQFFISNKAYEECGLCSRIVIAEANLVEKDDDYLLDTYDLVSSLYAVYSSYNQLSLASDLAELYQDAMVKVFVKATEEDYKEYQLLVLDRNSDTEDLTTYYLVKYNTELNGFDLLLEKNGTYELKKYKETPQEVIPLGTYSIEELVASGTNEIDLSEPAPVVQAEGMENPETDENDVVQQETVIQEVEAETVSVEVEA